MDIRVKQEYLTTSSFPATKRTGNKTVSGGDKPEHAIDLSSSSEDTELAKNRNETAVESADRTGDSPDYSRTFSVGEKRPRSSSSKPSSSKRLVVVLPEEEEEEELFGQSIPQERRAIVALPATPLRVLQPPSLNRCKQFWKAGDYEGTSGGDWEVSAGGFDHVRVHPRFLHSNATSHKWALGAFAELLDNALDEVHSGASYVNIDVLHNRKDGSKMVVIEDNGGGMNPETMRHCMSLGYSAKSKLANTIGQYGNGFKTSTMRLGADVIVFSRCRGKDGKSSTQSIGLLSYTFLKSTGKEDIVVPMLDYERRGSEWCQIVRSSVNDWERNVETVVQWSPYATEDDLLSQFNLMKDHGTRIIIYNLWEDDEGMLELDFDTDPHDIQLRGGNRDEKNIGMAAQYPNSRHFLTYKHSLRSYVSILYLKIAPGFRIILRGIDVEHHNIVNDMMHADHVTYRPKEATAGLTNFANISAVVTIGFVKDAKHHIDVQGFNVYHKNRLIKPFWRIWNAAGSDGRGVIGVLEANFVEPAHDKQGFERTTVLSRLEARLLIMQKNYWRSKCEKIGYAPRQGKKSVKDSEDGEESSSPEYDHKGSASSRKRTTGSRAKTPSAAPEKFNSRSTLPRGARKGSVGDYSGGSYVSSEKGGKLGKSSSKSNKRVKPQETHSDDDSDDDSFPERNVTELPQKAHAELSQKAHAELSQKAHAELPRRAHAELPRRAHAELPRNGHAELPRNGHAELPQSGHAEFPQKSSDLPKPRSGSRTLSELEEENEELRKRLEKKEEVQLLLQEDLRREKELRKKLEAEVQITKEKLEENQKEQESLIDIFSEDRDRRDKEEENLRTKLKEASKTIQELLNARA